MVLSRAAGAIALLLLVALLQACAQQTTRAPVLVPGQVNAPELPAASGAPQVQEPAAPPPASEDRVPTTQQPPVAAPSHGVSHAPSAEDQILDRAAAALSLSQWKQASRYLEQAQRIAPRYPRVYLLFGDYFAELNKTAQARAMYQRGISVSAVDSHWRQQLLMRLRRVE